MSTPDGFAKTYLFLYLFISFTAKEVVQEVIKMINVAVTVGAVCFLWLSDRSLKQQLSRQLIMTFLLGFTVCQYRNIHHMKRSR